MRKASFGQLAIGDLFWKEGTWFKKIEPIRSGPCQCISATAVMVQENPTPLRLWQDSEEVEINE